jgi:hypothetical protein
MPIFVLQAIKRWIMQLRLRRGHPADTMLLRSDHRGIRFVFGFFSAARSAGNGVADIEAKTRAERRRDWHDAERASWRAGIKESIANRHGRPVLRYLEDGGQTVVWSGRCR